MSHNTNVLKLTLITFLLLIPIRCTLPKTYWVKQRKIRDNGFYTEDVLLSIFFDNKAILMPRSKTIDDEINFALSKRKGPRHALNKIKDPKIELIDPELQKYDITSEDDEDSVSADFGVSDYLQSTTEKKIKTRKRSGDSDISSSTSSHNSAFQKEDDSQSCSSISCDNILLKKEGKPRKEKLVIKVDLKYIQAICTFECYLREKITQNNKQTIFQLNEKKAIEFERFKRMVLSRIRYDRLFPKCKNQELLSFVALAAMYTAIGEYKFEPIMWVLAYISWSTNGLLSIDDGNVEGYNSRGLIKLTTRPRYNHLNSFARKTTVGKYINFDENPEIVSATCPMVFCFLFDYAYNVALSKRSLEEFLKDMRPANISEDTVLSDMRDTFFTSYMHYAYSEFTHAVKSCSDELGYSVFTYQ